MMSIMLIFTGCNHDNLVELIKTTADLKFKAINCSAGGEDKPTAQSNKELDTSITISVTMIINGQTTIKGITKKGNELPVMAGNEVEIEFTPSCPNETEAFFTMPDGTTQKVTTSSPSFKWIVPDNIKTGMEIKGESTYKKENTEYEASGKIILISIEG